MTITKDLKYSISEVLDVLKHMDEDDVSQIPLDIIKNLNANKDDAYVSTIDFTKPLQENNLSNKALSILAYIYKDYLCTPEEKSEYEKVLYNNQMDFEASSNGSNIFENRKSKLESEETVENIDLPANVVHEGFFKKIIDKIKEFLKINK